MIFVTPENKIDVERKLASLKGTIKRFEFINQGCKSWKV